MKQTAMEQIRVFAPASIGNVSAGFDLLGAALAPIDGSLLGDQLILSSCAVSTASDAADLASGELNIQLTVSGAFADKLPTAVEQNIVYQCAQYFLAQQASAIADLQQGLVLELVKNLPIGSGLGSSASSVVVAFYGLNQFFGEPYTQDELLTLMGEFEGRISGSVHYDNVAPSYLGGLQLMTATTCASLPSFESWYWLVAYSGQSLSTSIMRQLLPEDYPKATAIEFAQHLASFVHACHSQDQALALENLQDVIAEPYRAAHIPNYQLAKHSLLEMGMATVGISGSGPTLFAVTTDLALAQRAQTWLEQNYCSAPQGFSHICQLDVQGARRLSCSSQSK